MHVSTHLMNIETALINYINDGILGGKSPITLQGYQYSIKSLVQYIKNAFASQELSSLDIKLIETFFVQGVKIKGWNKYTYWTRYKDLNVFFNWCVKKGHIKSNPLEQLPKPKMPQTLPKSLNEKEVILLLKIVSALPYHHYFLRLRNKAIIATLLLTGLRKSELLNLRFNDVDLNNNFILVENGKGGKRREIPIQEEVLKPVLQEYVDYRYKLGKTSDWFFNGTFSNRGKNDNKLSSTTFNQLFWTLSKKLGKRVYAHMLRHTFATLLLEKTGDIYVLKELLGHSNIKTTTIYLSTTRRKKVEVINKLGLDL